MPATSTVNPACAEVEGEGEREDGYLQHLVWCTKYAKKNYVYLTVGNTLKAIYVHAFCTGVYINIQSIKSDPSLFWRVKDGVAR